MKARIATVAATAALTATLSTVPAAAETVKLVTGNGYKPHADKNLEHGGMFTQIVRGIYQDMGYNVKIDFKPWNRGEKMVINDQRLATFPLIVAEDRKKKFYFSDPVTVFDQRPMVMKGRAGKYQSFEDLKGTTGCLPTGWAVGPKFGKMREAGHIKLTRAKLPNCFKLLKAGRVDYVPAAPPTAKWAAKEALGSTDAIEADGARFAPVKLHLVFDKDEKGKKARNEFNKGLKKFREAGKIAKTKNQCM